RAGEAGLRVRPLEDRALGSDDEIARHGQAEAARGGDAVDRGDERLRRAADLRDRRVDVFEDLLEAVAVGRFRHAEPRRGRSISECEGRRILRSFASLRMTTVADLFQVGAAAEDAALPAHDRGAHVRVARELQTGFAEVARGLDVERVEALAAVDGENADAVADFR